MSRSGRKTFRIKKAEQIRALGSPVRQDLVDCLQAAGPCTVAQLARLLGRPADSLYYHLRHLEALELVVRPSAGAGRGPGARFALPAPRPQLEYRPGDPRNVEAVTKAAGTMLRSATRSFRKAFTPRAAIVGGSRRNLWAGRTLGWLSDAELARVNALIDELVELIRRPRPEKGATRRLHEFTYVLAPVREHAPRRAG